MLRYILKRLLAMIPVLIGISFLISLLMYFTPGDPAQMILGDLATEAEIAALREKMGLTGSFFQRYFRYMGGVLHGDLGISYVTNQPVLTEIMVRFPITARIALLVIILASLIGIPVGIISAVRQYSFLDNITRVIAMLGITIPSFWLALLLVLAFAVNLKWFPASGLYGPIYYVLPVFSISAVPIARITRMTRSAMLEVVRQDYIRTARSKGQTEMAIIFKHELKNALIPILTIIGIQFASGLGGAVVNEQVFAIPGLGKYMVDAIRARNYPVIQSTVLLLALFQSLVNLAVDIIYAYVDPRIRSQYARTQKKQKALSEEKNDPNAEKEVSNGK